MTHSSAYGNWPSPWPVEVDEEVDAVRRPIYDSFRCGQRYVQAMWCRVAEAKGALDARGTYIDLDPVIDFLMFVQEQLFEQGLRVGGDAQNAVYVAWREREPIWRQQRRSLARVIAGAHDPEVAHVL